MRMLGRILEGRRRFRKIDCRTAAAAIGVSSSTLARVEAGGMPDLATLRACCKWLEIAPSTFLDDEDDGSPASPQPSDPDAGLGPIIDTMQ